MLADPCDQCLSVRYWTVAKRFCLYLCSHICVFLVPSILLTCPSFYHPCGCMLMCLMHDVCTQVMLRVRAAWLKSPWHGTMARIMLTVWNNQRLRGPLLLGRLLDGVKPRLTRWDNMPSSRDIIWGLRCCYTGGMPPFVLRLMDGIWSHRGMSRHYQLKRRQDPPALEDLSTSVQTNLQTSCWTLKDA